MLCFVVFILRLIAVDHLVELFFMKKPVVIKNYGFDKMHFFSPWIKLLKELTLLGYSLLNMFECVCV